MTPAVRSPHGRLARIAVPMALAAIAGTGVVFWEFSSEWWGWAPEVYGTWPSALLFVWMAWAACAAWVLLPVVRGPLVDRQRASVRARVARTGRPLVTLAAWQTAAALLPLVGALALLQVTTGIRWVFPGTTTLWVASVVVTGWAYLALGALVAAALRHVAAVLVAPTAVYLVFLLPPSLLASPSVEHMLTGMSWTWEVPSLLSVAGRLGFWCGFLWILLALLTHPRRARLHLTAAAAFTVSATAVVVTEGWSVVPVPGAANLVCTQSQGSEYCTTQVYAAGAPAVVAILDEGFAQLPEDYRPARIASDQDVAARLDTPASVVEPVPANGYTVPTNLPGRAFTLVPLGDHLLGGDACTDETVTGDEAVLALRYWWRGQFGLAAHERYGISDYDARQLYPPDVIARAQARAAGFAALPEAERKRFLAEHRTEIQSCTLPADTIPGG